MFVVNADWFFLSHRLPIAEAARDAGFRVTVAAGDTGDSAEITERGLDFVSLPVSRGSVSPFEAAAAIVCLARAYRSKRPDIVHHVSLKAIIYGGIAARVTPVPRVINALSGLGYTFIEGKDRLLLRSMAETVLGMALRHPDSRLILQNVDDITLLAERGLTSRDKIVLIRGSGVDCTRFDYTSEPGGDSAIIVLPARMLWDKGVAEFVEAARLLHKRDVSARFLLVGGADSENPAAIPIARLESWQREGVVEWMGHQNDMPNFLRSAHLVVLPSYREGLPKALLEAAAVGRAIVTTDVPGCREVVTDRVNGLLVPPRNSRRLADAIMHLVRNPEERRAYGREGRSIVEKEFSVQRVVRQTIQLYSTMLRPCALY